MTLDERLANMEQTINEMRQTLLEMQSNVSTLMDDKKKGMTVRKEPRYGKVKQSKEKHIT